MKNHNQFVQKPIHTTYKLAYNWTLRQKIDDSKLIIIVKMNKFKLELLYMIHKAPKIKYSHS